MKFAVIACVFLCGVAASPQWPIYTSQYASVYYQPEKDVPQNSNASETPEITTERESEQIKGRENDEVQDKLTQAEEEEAVYYIYHPSGLLQRVVYLGRDDTQDTAAAYTAQFKYEDVEPIKEPIFTYDPETFVLHQLQR